MYDWANGGNIEDVVDDIERIDMEYNDQNPKKLCDWLFLNLSELDEVRQMYSRRNRSLIIAQSHVPLFEVSEMYHFGDDVKKIAELQELVNI